MKEGEPVLGGPQVVPGSTPMSNVGPQPINPAASSSSSSDFSSFQFNSQPQPVPRLTNRFSDRATFNQPPQTPFTNNIPPNMQFTPPGPISSSPSGPQKSKKGLIIGVILVLILLAVGIAAISLKSNFNFGSGSAQNAFESFVSYLMHEDDNSNVKSFDATQTYAIDTFFQEQGNNQSGEYFEELNKHWQSFTEKNTVNFNQDTINIISGDVEALNLYIKYQNIPKEELLSKYLQEGRDIVFTPSSDYSVENNNKPSDILSQYMAARDDYLNRLIGLFDNYIENGCVVSGNFDEGCVRSKGLYRQDTYKQFQISKETLQNYAYELKSEIKEQTGKLLISMEQKNDS